MYGKQERDTLQEIQLLGCSLHPLAAGWEGGEVQLPSSLHMYGKQERDTLQEIQLLGTCTTLLLLDEEEPPPVEDKHQQAPVGKRTVLYCTYCAT